MNQLSVKLSELTLEEKIGQMFMARGLSAFPGEVKDLLERGLIGGIQAKSHEDFRTKFAALQKQARIPLFVAADMEFGFTGTGFQGTPMPCAMALGAIGKEKTAYAWASVVAREARAYGVNFVFGPVLDVALDPRSPMVNIRAISAHPDEVIRLGSAVVRGYQDHGMQVSAKHYPGAGRSPVDNHIQMCRLLCNRRVFTGTELRIYREVIQRARLSGIMTGHILVPAVDPEAIATVSSRLVNCVRRKGFSGIIISDSLAMKGVKTQISPDELAVRVMASGHDIILGDYSIPPRVQLACIINAVKRGQVSEAVVDRAVRRILAAKAALRRYHPEPVNRREHRDIALAINRQAVTVTGSCRRWLANRGRRKTLFIVTVDSLRPQAAMEIGGDTKSRIVRLLAKHFPGQRVWRIPDAIGPAEIEKMLDVALDYDHIVFITYALPHSYKGTADLPNPLLALIGGLAGKLDLIVLFGNPYAARHFPPAICVMYPYWGGQAEQAAVEVLAGAYTPKGQLPVQWNDT